MNGTIACLVFKTARCFDKLGGKPVATWMITNIHGCRGIERLLFFADARFIIQAKTLADEYGYDCYELPWQTSTDATRLRQWLQTKLQLVPRSIVLAEPVFPFLPSEKIEACVAYANRTKTTTLVGRVFASARVPLPDFCVQVATTTAAKQAVEINMTASLDARNQDEFTVADALRLYSHKEGKK